MDDKNQKEVVISKKLSKQLASLKKENNKLYSKVLAGVYSLSTYRAEDNALVTKSIEKGLYELKIDGFNKYIRVFYSEDKDRIYCWELLEKKTNKIPKDVITRLKKLVSSNI